MFYNICLSGYDIETEVIYLKFLLLRLERNVEVLLFAAIVMFVLSLYQNMVIEKLKKDIRTKLLNCAKEEQQ